MTALRPRAVADQLDASGLYTFAEHRQFAQCLRDQLDALLEEQRANPPPPLTEERVRANLRWLDDVLCPQWWPDPVKRRAFVRLRAITVDLLRGFTDARRDADTATTRRAPKAKGRPGKPKSRARRR